MAEGLVYGLSVYVDNVKLSHFTRAMITEHQLREELVHQFRDLDPPVTFSDPDVRVQFRFPSRD